MRIISKRVLRFDLPGGKFFVTKGANQIDEDMPAEFAKSAMFLAAQKADLVTIISGKKSKEVKIEEEEELEDETEEEVESEDETESEEASEDESEEESEEDSKKAKRAAKRAARKAKE